MSLFSLCMLPLMFCSDNKQQMLLSETTDGLSDRLIPFFLCEDAVVCSRLSWNIGPSWITGFLSHSSIEFWVLNCFKNVCSCM